MSDSDNTIAKKVLGNPWVRAGGILLILAVLIFVLYGLSFVLVPLLMAFIVAYILDPVVDWFEARKISRGVAIGTLVSLAIGAALAFFIYVPLYALDQADELAEAARETSEDRESTSDDGSWRGWLDSLADRLPLDEFVDQSGWREQYLAAHNQDDELARIESELNQIKANSTSEAENEDDAENSESETLSSQTENLETDDPERDRQLQELDAQLTGLAPPGAVIGWRISTYVKENLRTILRDYGAHFTSAGQEAGRSIASLFKAIGGGTVSVIVFLGNLAIFGFVGGFLLKDYDGVVATMGSLVPPKARPRLFDIMRKIDTQLRSFLVGQLTVCGCLALMYAIGLFLSDVPFWFMIALFGGFATLIPFFGVMMTFIPSALLTLIYHGVDEHLLFVIITFVVVQALEGNVVTPFIMGNTVGLHPVWVILAVMVFGSLLGFAGLLIAVPLAAILKVLVTEAVDYYRASSLFNEEAEDTA